MLTMDTPFEQRMKILENEISESEEHVELKQRLKKTLYYGKMKNMDRPSLAMTELAVEFLQELAPKELGRIDMYWASSLSRDVSVTPCALMLALMYVKRLKHSNSQYLSQVSSSDLFLISVLVASKYLYDEGESDDVSNIQWASLTKVDVEDINENERSFLNAMDWKVFVKPDDFWNFLNYIETKVAWRMSLKRNSFTYTELSVIISIAPLCQILYSALVELCKVLVVCSVTYAAGVTTLLLSNVMPAVVFSHAFISQSSVFGVKPGVISNISCSDGLFCCYRYLPIAEPVLTLKDSSNDVVSCCLDHPQFSKRQNSYCNPRTCIRASACVTVALIRALMISTYSLINETISAIAASCAIREDDVLVSHGLKHCPVNDSLCSLHKKCCRTSTRNTRQQLLYTEYAESRTIFGSAMKCHQQNDMQESQGECCNSLTYAGIEDNTYQNLFASPCNYTTAFSSMTSLYKTTEVFG